MYLWVVLYLGSQLQSNLVCFSLQPPTVGAAKHQLEQPQMLDYISSLIKTLEGHMETLFVFPHVLHSGTRLTSLSCFCSHCPSTARLSRGHAAQMAVSTTRDRRSTT